MRAFEEALRGDALLVFEDLHVRDAGCVVDCDMYEVPADASIAVLAPARDSMAHASDSPEFLDVEVQELAGPLLLVASDRLGWSQLR